MSIVEVINERNELTRLDFWDDEEVRVVQTHTLSYEYIHKRKEIAEYLIANSGLLQNPLFKEIDARLDNYFKAKYGDAYK